MSKALYNLADVEAMLAACAPDTKMVLKLHRYWVIRGAKRFTDFPKGEGAGGERKSRIRVENGRIRKCVAVLDVNVACVEKHLPGVCKAD